MKALSLLAILLATALTLSAQISPGPLARAHQGLSGGANCTRCHEVNTHAPSFKCTDCHKEIAAEIAQNRGLHATFPRGGPAGSACVKCHSDHNGTAFQMVHWTPTAQGFDHSKTGYTLDGKHALVGCRNCHTGKNIAPGTRALLSAKDLNHTWVGLSAACSTCHEDKHQGRFGADCVRCHATSGWQTASVDSKSFDHSKTRYPLIGMHRTVACQSCHTSGIDGRTRYTGLRFSSCADCHRDPHKGEFKQGCESCHSTAAWKKTSFVETFDHSKTNFPLLGKHLTVGCLDCHRNGDFKSPITHAVCADCHQPDPHGGQFASRPDGDRCESCHNVDGWRPSTFSVTQHAKTGFPLTFPHEKVACAFCHVPAGRDTRFKVKHAQCIDCHSDVHEGQFAGSPWRNRCEQCHNGATFHASSFTLAAHQKLTFPLTGGHMAVACNDCHKPSPGSKLIPFHFTSLSCTTCHEDIHHGQFADRMAAAGASGKPLGCEACHSTKGWHDLTRFDHAHTQFALTGSHRAVACADCHRPPNLERTMLHVQFSTAPSACSGCHEDPHGDQFGARGKDCSSCHSTNKWRPSLFDHDKTAFALKGGHENVACSACHTFKKPVDGIDVLFYKPTPTRCEACHGTSIPHTVSPHES